MSRRDLVRVEAEFVAFLRAVRSLNNDIGVRYGSWKGYCDQVVSSGEAWVTAKILERIMATIGDVPPLPPDGKAVLRRCLGTERDLDHPAANFSKNREFKPCYDQELRKIREAQVAAGAARRRPDGNAASVTDVGACPVPPLAASPAISLWRLPATGPVFVGRGAELRQLDAALASPTTHAVTIVGLPGSGKTALANQWLLRLGSGLGGMEAVFGWSFSAKEPLSHSLMVEQMLNFFGDPDPENGAAAVRAERLVKRIRDRRAIVVLDSLEAVQDPVSHAIQAEPVMILVRELARHLSGLLVMTSWFECPDVAHLGECAATVRISPLSSEDGRQLLDRMAVRADPQQTQALVERCDGHALSLRVFAGFARCLGGDVTGVLGYRLDEADRHQKSELAGIARAYDACLRPLDRAVLRVIATFSDGRLPGEALPVLIQDPGVAEVCGAPADCCHVQVAVTLSALEELGVLNRRQGEGGVPLVDLHPLVRQHYALAKAAEPSLRSGYRCLRDCYRGLADRTRNSTAELEYAYAAVASGIAAGLYDDALEDYRTRLNRGREGRTWDAFGHFSQDTELLKPLFAQPWDRPLAEISEANRAFLLFEVGWCLRAVGRLTECVAPLQAAIEANSRLGEQRAAMLAAIHLALVCLETGEIAAAGSYVSRSKESADRLGDPFWRQAVELIDGYVCWQAGNDGRADACYRQVSREGREVVEDPFNLGIGAYLICDYWLEREVENPGLFPQPLRDHRRNSPAWEPLVCWIGRLRNADRGSSLLASGLRLLATARLQTLHLLGMPWPKGLDLARGTVQEVLTGLEQAIQKLDESSLQHFMVPGLVAAAALKRALAQGGRDSKVSLRGTSVAALLDDSLVHARTALDTARRNGAWMHAVDGHLELARVLLVRGEVAEAGEHQRAAGQMIDQFGYERRRRELDALERRSSLDCARLGRRDESER